MVYSYPPVLTITSIQGMDQRRYGAHIVRFRQNLPAIFCFVLLLLCSFGLKAQDSRDSLLQRLDEWVVHPSFRTANDVSVEGQVSAYVLPNALLLRYLDNSELKVLTKANALSQADPAFVAVNPFKTEEILLAYQDGAIEVLSSEQSRHYLRSIANTQIIGRRDMRGLRYINEREALIFTDFGYLIIDTEEGIFLEDIRWPSPVLDAEVLNGDLYLATESGFTVLRNYLNELNLRDTSRYARLDPLLLAGDRGKILEIEAYEGSIHAATRDGLYSLSPEADEALLLWRSDCGFVTRMDANGSRLGLGLQVDPVCGPDAVVYKDPDQPFRQFPLDCISDFRDLAVASGDLIVVGGFGESGLYTLNTAADRCTSIALQGPATTEIFAIAARDGQVAVAAGGWSPQLDYTFNFAGLSVRKDDTWTLYNSISSPVFARQGDERQPLADLVAVEWSGEDELYGAAYFGGLVALHPGDPGRDERFDDINSSLGVHLLDPATVRTSGLAVDDDGNLWVSNLGAARALSVLTPEGEWHSFNVNNCLSPNLLRLIVAQRPGQSPIIYGIDFERGFFAFDANGTFDDPSDDRCRLFGTAQNLPNNDVRSLLLDRNGALWIGTSNGIAILQCADPFDPGCSEAFRPPVTVDGIPGFFFDGEAISAMVADGGNRKWIGTSNGLFLLSPNGQDQLAYFEERRSPLLDNQITALAIDDSNGLLWIGTDRGLSSLQTAATSGLDFAHETELEIWPQPVMPDYTGPITIRGLANNSNVKITDAAGRLVFETSAVGADVIWNGNDYTGNRAASGVYFIWGTAREAVDRPETIVGKIAFLR